MRDYYKRLEQFEHMQRRIKIPPFERAGGGVVCELCGCVYYDHPNHVPHEWLTVLCSGEHVKL